MKRTRTLIALLCVAAAAGCGKQPPEDSFSEKLADVMEEAPKPPTLDMEAPEAVATLDRNDLVSVLLVDLPAGEQIPAHEAGPRAVYALTESSLMVSTGEASDIRSYEVGEVDTWPAGTYSIENAGEDPARIVVVNRTAKPMPPSAEGMGSAAESESPAGPPVVLQSDERWEIERLALAPEMSGAMTCENPCAVFTLTPATLVVDGEDGESETMDVHQDRSVWFDGGTSWSVEAGEEPVGLVVFSVKS